MTKETLIKEFQDALELQNDLIAKLSKTTGALEVFLHLLLKEEK